MNETKIGGTKEKNNKYSFHGSAAYIICGLYVSICNGSYQLPEAEERYYQKPDFLAVYHQRSVF